MKSTVGALLAPGKGILAADESFQTLESRFKLLNIVSTEGSRREYREMLFTAPELNECISGVILFDETLRQRASNGDRMPQLLIHQRMVPGIKVDAGTVSMAGLPGEKITQGLDGLRERLVEYHALGARFTKWRAVIAVGETVPSRACIRANAVRLAEFAALSQEAGMVPIVEPEVLMSGDHTIARCEELTALTLKSVFDALYERQVVLEELILKTGMVLSGTDCVEQADVREVGERTLRCLRRYVPAAVPGVVFLSGGQSDVMATQRLNEICRGGEVPWRLSFSFGRALQSRAMECWNGAAENIHVAQTALLHRARCNGLAVRGRYSEGSERSIAE